MIEGDMKTNTNPKNNAPRDETTRTPGVKRRHKNEEIQAKKREKEKSELPGSIGNPAYHSMTSEQQETLDHVEKAEIKGLFHRRQPEKGFKK